MPATPGPYAGRKAKTYLNAGTHAAPTLVLMSKIADLKLPLSKGEVELADRESEWKKFLAGLKEAGISFKYNKRKHKTDAVFDALQASYLGVSDDDEPIEI